MHAKNLADVIKEMIEKDKFINMNVATDENYTVAKIAKIALKACDAEHLKFIMIHQNLMDKMRKDIDISILENISSLELKKLSDGISKFIIKK